MSEVRPGDIAPVAASVPETPSADPASPIVTEQQPSAAPEAPPVVETPTTPEATPAADTQAETPPAEGALLATETPKPEGEQKPEETPKVEEPPAPAEEIKYEFKLPEGMEIPEERAAPLTEWLGTHKIPAEDAQALMDMHLSAMQEHAEHLVAEQWRVFNEMNANKRAELMADPVLGGAGYQTNQTAVRRIIDLFVAPDDRPAFNQRMRAGGMLDDIQFFKLMYNIARRFGEPAPPPPNPAPVANGAGRAPRGGGSMYTYPRGGSGA